VRSSASDRGSVTVELAVLFPSLLGIVFGTVQAAEWYHVRSVCLAAAEVGVDSGRTSGARPDAAAAASGRFLGEVGLDADVSTAGTTATVVRVEVQATVPRVIPLPGLRLRVSQYAVAPREVFTVRRGG
jgi:Flp pilus assembly protein TadG